MADSCLCAQRKGSDGVWEGINFTYYGFFNALAYLFAVVMLLIMMGSIITLFGTVRCLACVIDLHAGCALHCPVGGKETAHVFRRRCFLYRYLDCTVDYFAG